MKLVYLDESGKEEHDVSVVAGLVVDAYRVHSSRQEWLEVLQQMAVLAAKPVAEFHMVDVYNRAGEWADVSHENRGQAVSIVLAWLAKKRHRVVFSATLKAEFDARVRAGCTMTSDLGSRWLSQAFHVTLSINKQYKGLPNNKGKSLLVFDQGSGYDKRLSKLLVSPPVWSDTYYDRMTKERQLGEIMDTSFFADSVHAPLIQLADTVAFILRRLAEIRDAGYGERFPGERHLLESWVGTIESQIQKVSHRYKKAGRCKCADLFWEIAPPSLRLIG